MTTTDTRTELAHKRPAQVVRTNAKTIDTTRLPSGGYRAQRGGATARKVWITAVFLILLFLSIGFALSMVQQYS